MPEFDRLTAAAGALLLAIATALGAWASHAADALLTADRLQSLNVAIDFQFFHGLGLLALALLLPPGARSRTGVAAKLMVGTGTVLFCGGVYVSVFEGPSALVGLAPIGGSLLIARERSGERARAFVEAVRAAMPLPA